MYPNEYPSVYTEEEICYAEFINNCICIANVNNYSHGMDADTLIKNYNRIINYLKAFPSFLSNVPLMQVYVARVYILQHLISMILELMDFYLFLHLHIK